MSIELTESQQYDLFFELAKNLSHPSRDVRVSTVFAIAQIANRRCTNLLLEKLDLEQDIFIKASLIRILGQIGTPNLLDPLEKYLHFVEPRIRANAIESIVQLKGRENTELSLRIDRYVRDDNNRVAATALKELLSMGDTRYLPLLKLMLKGTDPARKSSAIWVVGELGLEDLLDDVVFALYSENYQVHSIANRVLGGFSEKAIPILFENLSMGESLVKVYTFLFFAKYLKSITDEQKELLLNLIKEEEPYIASFILKILYQLRLPEGFEYLREYIFSEDENLRRVSVEGLYEFTNYPGSEDVLFRAVDEEKNPHLLSRLIHCFERFPSERAVNKLKELITHPDPRVCANAIEILGVIGDKRLIEYLNPYLENSNNRIMANAAVAVFRLGEKRVLGHLKQSLVSKDSSHRASAAFALGEIGSREVVEILIERLLDDAASVRKHVMKGLLKQDSENFQRLVDKLKGSEDKNARQVLAELSTLVDSSDSGSAEVENLLDAYAQKVQAFQVPEVLEPHETEKLADLLFSDDRKLQVYAAYVLGEHKVKSVAPRLICLLFERDDEVVGESMLALQKIDAKETLVFLRDIYPRLRGENMKLCARVMQSFSEGQLNKEYFNNRIDAQHEQALIEASQL